MRGEVYRLPARGKGREERGRRYAVVLQPDWLTLSTWIVACTSTSARETSFRPPASNRIFLLTHALATPSMQHTLSLAAASARALCGRARGRRTERHEKPLHPLRSTRHERRAMRPPLRTFIPRQALVR